MGSFTKEISKNDDMFTNFSIDVVDPMRSNQNIIIEKHFFFYPITVKRFLS